MKFCTLISLTALSLVHALSLNLESQMQALTFEGLSEGVADPFFFAELRTKATGHCVDISPSGYLVGRHVYYDVRPWLCDGGNDQ